MIAIRGVMSVGAPQCVIAGEVERCTLANIVLKGNKWKHHDRRSMANSRRSRDVRSECFNPFPRYLQIRHLLVRRISEGFVPGDRFPTEHAICDEFGVSRETVREALHGLESEGLIARYRGRGTFVVRLPQIAEDERLTGLVEDFTELRLNTCAKVIRSGVENAPPRVIRALHLDRGAEVFRIRRLRRVDDRPLACHEAFLPLDIGTDLARLDLTHTTLFRELRRKLGVRLVEIYQQIDAVAADVDLARLLEIQIGAPLLVTRRAFGNKRSGTPTMYFEAYFRADRYYYSVQVDRDRKMPASAGLVAHRNT
jgi:GntR family transcriptional regulator